MPEKDGADDKKTTKSVVNKKQKQMMGEEGYDRYRDRILMRGGDHRSDETKNRSYTPTGKQPKGKTVLQKQTEKKYGKGKSALDIVKADITAKYGKGAIMNVKKEELDLTQVAESFGGHIVEYVGTIGTVTAKVAAKQAAKQAVKQGAKQAVKQGGGAIVKQGGGAIVKQGGGQIVKQGGGQIVKQGGNKIVKTGRTFGSFQDKVKTVTPEIVGGEVKKSSQLAKIPKPKSGPTVNVTPLGGEITKTKSRSLTTGVKDTVGQLAGQAAIDKITEKKPKSGDEQSRGIKIPKAKGGYVGVVHASG